MTIIEFIVANFLMLMLVFAWVMKIRDKFEGTPLEPWLRVIIGFPSVLFDWYVNTFAATLFFLDPPEGWELATGRFKRYKKEYSNHMHLNTIKKWRLWWAEFFCNFANKFDMGHC